MPGYLLDPASYASGIAISASGNISAPNVQDAIYELDSEKSPISSPTFTGTVTLPSNTSIGNVSSTEIGYIDGLTSSVQGQISSVEAIAMLGL